VSGRRERVKRRWVMQRAVVVVNMGRIAMIYGGIFTGRVVGWDLKWASCF